MTQEQEFKSQNPQTEFSNREVLLERTRLRLIKRLVAEGRLQPDILERAQSAFQGSWSQEKSGQTDQAGPGVEAISKQEEENQPTLIKVFKQSQQVQLEGWVTPRKISSKINWEMLIHLLKNAQQEVSTSSLREIAQRLGSKDSSAVGNRLRRLREIIEPDLYNPTIIVASYHSQDTTYRLNARVEFVGEEKKSEKELEKIKTEEEAPKEFPPPLHQSRIDALTMLVLGTKSVDEIRHTLGPAIRSGRQLTDQQVSWALIGSINKLYGRVKKGIANASELEIWETIRKETDIQEDGAILDFVRERTKLWIKGETGITLPTPDWEMVFGPLSSEEALILILFLEYHQDLLEKYQLPKLPEGLSQKLKAGIQTPLNYSTEELNEFRMNSLLKVRDIIRGEKLDKIYDLQDPEIQTLLVYFMEIESQGAFDFMEDLLRTPQSVLKEQMEGIRRQLVAIDLQDIPAELPHTLSVERPRIRKIEQRDPEIRQTINLYLDQIAEKGITKPISSHQLTSLFQRVKTTHIDSAVGKGYIRPGHGREYYPVFTVEEIALLLYVRERGSNLTPRLAKEIREIIREEIARRSNRN